MAPDLGPGPWPRTLAPDQVCVPPYFDDDLLSLAVSAREAATAEYTDAAGGSSGVECEEAKEARALDLLQERR